MKEKEFYIGWMPKAPESFAKHTKKVVIILTILFTVVATTLALLQKQFGTGNFEFGKPTELKGIYFNQPVSCIKVVNGKDIFGNSSYITIPLVGFGKFGAEGIINNIEQEKNISLHQKEVVLKGTLLYNDGKTLMQIDANDKPLVSIGKTADKSIFPIKKELGWQTVKGEIVDPKCYFGIMKPGQGKPHKDCAIRCILGGIPPVLRVSNENGEENYYLIVGPQGEKMNQTIKDYVAEPVEITARMVKYDDWIVLYVNNNGIKQYAYLRERFGNTLQLCSNNANK